MLDIILIILGVLCLITGLMGCILPFLPGPPVAYLGLVLLHFTDKVQYHTTYCMAADCSCRASLGLLHPYAWQQV